MAKKISSIGSGPVEVLQFFQRYFISFHIKHQAKIELFLEPQKTQDVGYHGPFSGQPPQRQAHSDCNSANNGALADLGWIVPGTAGVATQWVRCCGVEAPKVLMA